MSNFTFLTPNWPDLFETAREAEQNVASTPLSHRSLSGVEGNPASSPRFSLSRKSTAKGMAHVGSAPTSEVEKENICILYHISSKMCFM